MLFQEQIVELRECVFDKKINTAVIGMPETGKSRLIKEALRDFYSQQCQKGAFEKVIFVHFCLMHDSDFFEELVERAYDELQEKSCSERKYKKIENLYNEMTATKSYKEKLDRFFDKIVGDSFYIVICVDNFHYIQDKFTLNDYGKIRQLSDTLGIVFVLASIYPIELLETCRGDNSNLQAIFRNLIYTIPLREDDLTQYLDSEFVKKPELEKYGKQLVDWSGGHPGILAKCLPELEYKHSHEQILKTVNTQYNAIEKKLKEKADLLYEAIKTVIGPIYNTDGDKRKTLSCYGYLRKVSEDYKKNILKAFLDESSIEDYLGFQDKDGLYYVLFSDYYTVRFIKKFRFERAYFPIWNKTESLLRKVVRKRLKELYGLKYEDKIIAEDENMIRANKQRTQEITILGINQTQISPDQIDILEYLDTNVLFQRFILGKEFWKYYEERIFFSYKKDKWVQKFNLLAAIRRPLCHNRNFESDKFEIITKFYREAEQICEEISNAINKSNVLDEIDS